MMTSALDLDIIEMLVKYWDYEPRLPCISHADVMFKSFGLD